MEEAWPDRAERIPSLATFRAARTGVSAPSVVETGTRAETLMTTEGTETRLRGARKDDGEGGTSCHSSTSRPQIQDHPLRVGELWLDCAKRISSSATFRAARIGVLVPSVVEKGIRAEAPSTTEGAETRLRGARKDDGEGGTSCHSSAPRPQIQDHPLRVGELWPDCAERIPSSAAFRAAWTGVSAPSVVRFRIHDGADCGILLA